MALSKKDMELAKQAEKEQFEERVKAYENAKEEEQKLLKLKIKNGKLTADEEKKLEAARQKRRDNYDAWAKKKKDDTDKAAKDAQDEIDMRIDAESGFYSFATSINNDLHSARMAGNKELEESLESLQGKTFAVAEAEDKIGTSKYVNIDYSTELAALEKKRINLQIELNRAIESGDPKAIAAVQRKIDANDEETKGVQILHDKGKIMNRQNEILTDGLKPLEDMKDKFENIAMTLEAMVSNPMFLMVVLAAALVKHFTATEESFENFRKNLGITVKEAGKLQDQAMGVAKNMASSGVSLDDALGATEALVNEFGDMGMATEQNLETVLRMNKALGMSNDEAAKFLHLMSNILGATTEEAEALAAGATNLARQAGVAPATVIADMSANADSFAAYIKDGGKNLAEAAVFAAKMGTSVSTLTGIADSLLDIESSIEAQMEAQVLTGKNINLEKARQLAYDGDIAGMAAEISKQVGSAAEFEAMRPEARKAMAKAMGMEVSELSSMISKQETLQKLADGTLSTQEALADLPLSEVMDAKGITSGITDIKNSIKAIALNLMEVFRPVFSFVAMILKPIASTLGFVAKVLNNPLAKGILYFYLMWKLVNSEIAFGYALKVKDFVWWMGSQIKQKAMMMKNFLFDRKNYDFRIIKEKLLGGLKENFHKKEMLRKKAEQSLDAKGFKSKFAAMKEKIMGKGKGGASATGTDATPTPSAKATPGQSKGTGGMMQSVGKIDFNKVLKGAAAMIIVAGALFIFAKALKELPTDPAPYIGAAVGLGMLMGAVFLMGKMQGQLIQGSVAMLLMGAAFLPFAFGLSLLTGLDFGAVIAAAGALLIFTGAIFGLGALMMSGVGAVLFGAGIIALTAMGAAMIVFGAGLMVVATAAGMLVEHLTGVATGLTELVAASDGIFSLALGLGALALGFISLAGSLAILLPFLPLLMILGASGVIGQVLGTAPPGEPAEGGGGEKKQSPAEKDRQRMITLLEQLVDSVRQGGVVKLDGKKVGEVLGEGAGMGPLVG
tara:strand:- start:1572 stop:4622 length:3051 start_codon:yes stop_codon:yes gene_type:complete